MQKNGITSPPLTATSTLKKRRYVMSKKLLSPLLAGLLVLAYASAVFAGPKEDLGKILYFDRYLSANQNQSCASCHDPDTAGFADPLNQRLPGAFPVSVGSFTNLVGGRNAPPASYAVFSPSFHFDTEEGLYFGGQFWDGRAADLKEQAKGPFLNPVEMAMPDMASVIAALKDPANPNAAAYKALFMTVYGINLAGSVDVAFTYDKLAEAIAAFEGTPAFKSFTSKFDAVMAGSEKFTADEEEGWKIFNREEPLPDGSGAGKCVLCHPAPLFTDFSYDNLGIPKSKNALLKKNPPDLGLGGVLQNPDEYGKFKVSSLRNLTLTAPYGHNGYFETLEQIVNFYNTRDIKPWPLPEVDENVNFDELGDLQLTPDQERQLVAFLKTLADRAGAKSYPPKMPKMK
jgi:cytochrome c peroxidase